MPAPQRMGASANSPLRALIDLAALRANFALFRRAAPRSKILAVVMPMLTGMVYCRS